MEILSVIGAFIGIPVLLLFAGDKLDKLRGRDTTIPGWLIILVGVPALVLACVAISDGVSNGFSINHLYMVFGIPAFVLFVCFWVFLLLALPDIVIVTYKIVKEHITRPSR